MPLKKRKLGNAGTTSDGGGVDSGDDDYGTRQFADKLGFNDPGVPKTLYQVWRSCMQHAMSDFGIFGPGESGRMRFAELCEWGAAHLAMAPKGQINYHQQDYRSALNQLMQDVPRRQGNQGK
ncbi:hypothetical protein BGX38DRAFT_1146911 [Terfezia claveryi]|nr:hypothetical protein BGX38DRAFT_1146911 [Terfezia claveryi]